MGKKKIKEYEAEIKNYYHNSQLQGFDPGKMLHFEPRFAILPY